MSSGALVWLVLCAKRTRVCSCRPHVTSLEAQIFNLIEM